MDPTTLPLADGGQHTCGCGDSDHGVPELDVRAIPHAIRHASACSARWSAIPTGGSLVLVAPHDPKPLLAQIAERDGPGHRDLPRRGPRRLAAAAHPSLSPAVVVCSYCGCESIEVVGRFMAEHVEIVNASGTLRPRLRRGRCRAGGRRRRRARGAAPPAHDGRGGGPVHAPRAGRGVHRPRPVALRRARRPRRRAGAHPARATTTPTPPSTARCGCTSTVRRTASSPRPRSPSPARSGRQVLGDDPSRPRR